MDVLPFYSEIIFEIDIFTLRVYLIPAISWTIIGFEYDCLSYRFDFLVVKYDRYDNTHRNNYECFLSQMFRSVNYLLDFIKGK